MTTDEQLTALGRVAMALQNENNKLRDALKELLEACGYFIKEANPQAYQQAEKALDPEGWRRAFREGDRDELDDDSFMGRVTDDDTEEDDE
jgi:hypothetical protein